MNAHNRNKSLILSQTRGKFIMALHYFDLLEVNAQSSADEIKAAQWAWLRLLHPDRHNDSRLATELSQQVNEAARTLLDPERRRAYMARWPQRNKCKECNGTGVKVRFAGTKREQRQTCVACAGAGFYGQPK